MKAHVELFCSMAQMGKRGSEKGGRGICSKKQSLDPSGLFHWKRQDLNLEPLQQSYFSIVTQYWQHMHMQSMLG